MRSMFIATSLLVTVALSACATAPKTDEGKAELRSKASAALSKAQGDDPTLASVVKEATAYAVFPAVGKGAAGVGGAYGKGVLYERGSVIGYCDMTQATIGLQLGGQTYTEIVCFDTPEALTRFKSGNFSFDAQATAVAVKSGAGTNAKYADGIAVFTKNEAGLMGEAAVGGQKFSYQPE
jgi:lipid-binding SYLF domain-containing protein